MPILLIFQYIKVYFILWWFVF